MLIVFLLSRFKGNPTGHKVEFQVKTHSELGSHCPIIFHFLLRIRVLHVSCFVFFAFSLQNDLRPSFHHQYSKAVHSEAWEQGEVHSLYGTFSGAFSSGNL